MREKEREGGGREKERVREIEREGFKLNHSVLLICICWVVIWWAILVKKFYLIVDKITENRKITICV